MSRLAPLALAAIVALSGCSPGGGACVAPPVLSAASAGILGYIARAPNLTSLAAASRAGGFAQALAGPGPFTVFAPTDAAFGRLAPAAAAGLLRPENRTVLTRVLAYHVVPGTLTAADLAARVAAGNGTATLTTVEGEPLTVTMTQGYLTLTDADGDRSYVETGDLAQPNGVIHVVNGILLPRLG